MENVESVALKCSKYNFRILKEKHYYIAVIAELIYITIGSTHIKSSKNIYGALQNWKEDLKYILQCLCP